LEERPLLLSSPATALLIAAIVELVALPLRRARDERRRGAFVIESTIAMMNYIYSTHSHTRRERGGGGGETIDTHRHGHKRTQRHRQRQRQRHSQAMSKKVIQVIHFNYTIKLLKYSTLPPKL
jgi:hypothetical protein